MAVGASRMASEARRAESNVIRCGVTPSSGPRLKIEAKGMAKNWM